MATPILKPDPASFHEYRGTSNPELTVFGPVSSRIKLPGLRKTAFTIDGFLSPAEASGLIQEAYQPCHGGFNRACVSAENGGGSQCCGIGGSSVRTQLQPAVTDVLWSRIAPLLPLRVRLARTVWMSPLVSFLRHEPGQKTTGHRDPSIVLDPATVQLARPAWSTPSNLHEPFPSAHGQPLVVKSTERSHSYASSRCKTVGRRPRGHSVADSEAESDDDLAVNSDVLFSTLSVVVFLNAPSEGGALRLHGLDGVTFVDIAPIPGRAVVFDHRIQHAHLASSQRRHVLRLDVLCCKGNWRRELVGVDSSAPLVPLPHSPSFDMLGSTRSSPVSTLSHSPVPDVTTSPLSIVGTSCGDESSLPVTVLLPPRPSLIKKRDRSVSIASTVSLQSVDNLTPPVVDEDDGCEAPPSLMPHKRNRASSMVISY